MSIQLKVWGPGAHCSSKGLFSQGPSEDLYKPSCRDSLELEGGRLWSSVYSLLCHQDPMLAWGGRWGVQH